MDLPLHYLQVKNIFNLALFDDIYVDLKFREIKKATITLKYIEYYQEHRSQTKLYDNRYLKSCIYEYLSKLNHIERCDIGMIVKENPDLLYATYMYELISDSKHIDFSENFDIDDKISSYIESQIESPHFLVLFFMHHFLNFDHIEIEKYKSFQLTRDEYFKLLFAYLQPQTKLF